MANNLKLDQDLVSNLKKIPNIKKVVLFYDNSVSALSQGELDPKQLNKFLQENGIKFNLQRANVKKDVGGAKSMFGFYNAGKVLKC